ncbi:EF-P lysine aminoacylase EpmA [Geobacter sp. SVR]|uniref:EF-P lysine aminoacylase EpmA n=1 Tax=Geobacter sp. SVR TaxID=2495594 RepID=UPI00143EFE5B|nr:EF-P lysine aminoacylase EpmA [Geobacter sp. SVR]BCS53863.1 EF-P lysine aminoacylase GenX [Geobacter sp. SVR]GCF85628.1 EF-P lysine aminoacylase GenX [Geobacter sp. SVR]
MPHRIHNLHLRAAIIRAIRSFFEDQGFLEVETPLRIPANAVEEHIEPLPTAHWYLQTSPEVCMKRLLCRGHDRIFQISRCWRGEERGRRHCPEFTMLEWYRSNGDYRDLMRDCENLLSRVVSECRRTGSMIYQGESIALDRKAEHLTVREAFARYCSKRMEEAVKDGSFDELMVTCIEPGLPRNVPVILKDYPTEMAALARLKPEDRSVAERFELYAGGLELANGFSELNDPPEQRERFLQANCTRLSNGMPRLPLPEPFLDELAAMPPSAGIALGVDRLVMLLADTDTIDDVVAFTPEEL